MIQGIYDSGTQYGTIAEELGIPNANSNGSTPGFTTTNISGMTGLGDGAGSLQKVNNNWEIDQAFSWVRNRHDLKFGFDYMSRRFAFYSPGAPNGSYTFSGIYSNFGLADFLFGSPISSRLDVTKFFSLQRFYFSWFVQDNWRVNSKLTINIGLRNDTHHRMEGASQPACRIRSRQRRDARTGRHGSVHRRLRAHGTTVATWTAAWVRVHA